MFHLIDTCIKVRGWITFSQLCSRIQIQVVRLQSPWSFYWTKFVLLEKDTCRCAERKCDVIALARKPTHIRCPRWLTGKCNGDNRYSLISSCGQRLCAKTSGIQKDIQHTPCFQGIYNLGNIPGYPRCLSFWKPVLVNLYLFGHELERPWTLESKIWVGFLLGHLIAVGWWLPSGTLLSHSCSVCKMGIHRTYLMRLKWGVNDISCNHVWPSAGYKNYSSFLQVSLT